MNIKTSYENYGKSIFDRHDFQRNQQSIFVSIVSYRDPNVIRTIESLFSNAKRPSNISVSVAASLFQNPEGWHQELLDLKSKFPDLVINILNSNKVHHLGELRNIADSAYNKEDYYLMISSSSEFDPHWDDILITEFSSIKRMRPDSKLVFTGDPRGWLPHDNIIPGYVFYTNHKTKVSMQREEYDGSRIPISSYSEQFTDNDINSDVGKTSQSQQSIDKQKEMVGMMHNEKFLLKYGFPKFSSRKFTKDEFIASSLGFSCKFVFAEAREYLKSNKINNNVIDEEDFNFISFINLFFSNFNIWSIRWVPVYHLYDREDFTGTINPSPKDFYEDKDLAEEDSYVNINKIIKDFSSLEQDKKFAINNILSVDWEENKFKTRDKYILDDLINCINIYISLYNFSTNENSLHWNKRF